MLNHQNPKNKMAKGNPFLGMARGSAGDFTYYRQGGEQVFRARNRHPSNPQTELQLLQRVVMLTSQRAYSMLQPICDHSFQGRKAGTPNQSRFTELNNAMMRSRLANAIVAITIGSDEVWQTEANYSSKSSMLPEYMPYVISEGTIAPLNAAWLEGKSYLPIGASAASPQMTYAQFAAALGVSIGDQLTFVQMTIDDTDTVGQFNGMRVARVILMPSDGDIDGPVFGESLSGILEIEPTTANAANQGEIYFDALTLGAGSNGLVFKFQDSANADPNSVELAPAAVAVIVSRQVGDVWQRSTQSLVLRPFTVGTGNLTWDHETDYIGDAMESFKRKQAASTLYLNQAED